MARPPSATVADLLALLASGEPVPAARLVQALGVTRPVLARLVGEAGEQVLRIGRARATAYVARTSTAAGGAWPLWRMRPDATLEELGTLYLLRGERFQFLPEGERPNLTRPVEAVPGHFPGLPWFLDDLRPQGFLGRSLAHRRGPLLGVPVDLNRWQLRDNMLAMTVTGGTAIGDLLLGGRAVEQALAELDAPPDAVPAADRAARYPQWAEAALAGEEIGSSPGGEQPKFTATVATTGGRYAALVKFAMAGDDPPARRRADLLVSEHLALQSLRAAGIPAAQAELIESGGHRFLEVRRFDRSPDILGRHGFVSLLALNAAFVGGDGRDWSLAGEQLAAQRWIDPATAARMAALYWFGRLIGNSDMHPGNLGFRLVDEGPLALAPAYDMLPMSLAPSRAGVLRPAAPVEPGVPERTGQRDHIARAATVASDFWEQVAEDPRIGSDELRALAARNRDAVVAFAQRFGG
ncbi:type II toxin-antitoxin system HipA family toxin YjjJ [Luteimonas sp. RD2P54]|uniref:Type II toxin-antitoxin system HipA family toxin YjjJ n=1 Tax=Luteimonas endophytica TaxID=3042023 RepID=A0ABT6J4Z9_9GAMM|nr:type II toxin-antitoxin system HipA family toxin YjjJ [Luteimonas endophytica]MDH5821880.1 type II toxin-antitoxin system HipA family toxin YjjJ [Luteimonas endophytica]